MKIFTDLMFNCCTCLTSLSMSPHCFMHCHIQGRIVSHHFLKLSTLQMYTWTKKITICAERESVHHYHSSQSSLWCLDQACLTTLLWPLPPGNIEAMSDRGNCNVSQLFVTLMCDGGHYFFQHILHYYACLLTSW